MSDSVVVVGGANIDITAAPYSGFKEHDSNPGHSTISFGGVGRNIAENLSRLGCKVRFVSVFGDDSFSRALTDDLENKGIDISLCKTIRGQSCSKYVCINSDKGELIAAINDMSLYDHMDTVITPETIEAMNEADMVVLDANTTQDLLERIVPDCRVPIAFDAVSISKVFRCRNILDKLFIFKPNLYEAEELCRKLESSETLYPQDFDVSDTIGTATHYASILLGHGVRNVMISLGSEGVYYDNGTERGIIPSMAYEVINTSGCGDTFLSGTIKGYLNGGSIKDMARYGSAAAAICAASEDTVAPGLSPEKLFEILDRHSM